MPKFYHGTSADNLQSILKNGFDGTKGKQVWMVSGGANYFWNPLDIQETEDVDPDQAEDMAKRFAFEAAETSLAKSKDCRRIVFEIEAPESLFSPDNSCPNMQGAVVSDETIDPSHISRYWIDADDLSFFRAYFAACIHDRKLANPLNLSDAELSMVKAMQKSDTMCEIMESLSDIACEALEVKVK